MASQQTFKREPRSCDNCKANGFPNEKFTWYDTGNKKPDGSTLWGKLNPDGTEHFHKKRAEVVAVAQRAIPQEAYSDTNGTANPIPQSRPPVQAQKTEESQEEKADIFRKTLFDNLQKWTIQNQGIKDALDRIGKSNENVATELNLIQQLLEPILKDYVKNKGFPTAAELAAKSEATKTAIAMGESTYQPAGPAAIDMGANLDNVTISGVHVTEPKKHQKEEKRTGSYKTDREYADEMLKKLESDKDKQEKVGEALDETAELALSTIGYGEKEKVIEKDDEDIGQGEEEIL